MLKNKTFLTQTDTTIGFVSKLAYSLNQIKQRPPHKHYIRAIESLSTLKSFTRVPSIHKNMVRRAKKTSFIMPSGESYRVIRDTHHLLLLRRLGWLYTSSANLSGKEYDEKFAIDSADVIVSPLSNTKEASTIYKIGKRAIKRIR